MINETKVSEKHKFKIKKRKKKKKIIHNSFIFYKLLTKKYL